MELTVVSCASSAHLVANRYGSRGNFLHLSSKPVCGYVCSEGTKRCSRSQRLLKCSLWTSDKGFKGVGNKVTFWKLDWELLCSSGVEREDIADDNKTQDARSAVSDVLLKAGLSEEDAANISFNSPLFLQNLIRRADEEYELKIWTSATSTKYDETTKRDLYRESIQKLAEKTMGSAMALYLESLGVQLPQVSRVSRSLASQPLPNLLLKVRFVENLLAITEQSGRPLDDFLQVMMCSMSLAVDDDLQRTLSFFEKMNALRGGLGALNKSQFTIARLIESFPQIFIRTLEGDIMPIVRHLEEDLGVPKDCLGWVILSYPPVLLQTVGVLRLRTRSLKKVGVRARDLGRMLVKYPWLLSRTVENNVEAIVEFLSSIKVPLGKVDGVLRKYPQILGCSTDHTLLPMVHQLNDAGVKSRRLGNIISCSPQLLVRTPQQFSYVVALLEKTGITAKDLTRILLRSPEIFASNVETTLQRKLDFLKELGVRGELSICRVVRFYPEVLSMSVDGALRPRMEYLRSVGFCRKDVAFMVSQFPPLLGYNVETVLQPKLHYLTQIMRRSLEEVVQYPKYFSYSLEKKIKPRARVIANRNLHCDLRSMLGKNNDEFAAEYLGFQRILIPASKNNI